MEIGKAIAIVKATNKPIFVPPKGPPATATLWNVTPGEFIQEAVYFAYSAGLIKIGYTMAPRKRLETLMTAAAMPVTMVLIIPGTMQDERKFHNRFAEDRVHHEWFRLSKKMRDFFKARLCPIGRASLKAAEASFKDGQDSSCFGLAETFQGQRQSPSKQRPARSRVVLQMSGETVMDGAQVTKRGALDMQVCVPSSWTDEQVKSFADQNNLCGTENGWQIRRQGDKASAGCDERVQCKDDPSFVHIMLDA